MRSFATASFVLAFAASSVAEHIDIVRTNSHRPLNRINDTDLAHTAKRDDNGRFTYYAPGMGACGQENTESDFIVAVNPEQYESGSHCLKTIVVSSKGKSREAQIVDECPGCPHGGLDMSPALFKFFASEDEGVIYGSWDFAYEGGDGDGQPSAQTNNRKAYAKSSSAHDSKPQQAHRESDDHQAKAKPKPKPKPKQKQHKDRENDPSADPSGSSEPPPANAAPGNDSSDNNARDISGTLGHLAGRRAYDAAADLNAKLRRVRRLRQSDREF